MSERSLVELYTDGACSGNPGPGGYGLILRYVDKRGALHEKEQSEGFPETTNNRMELLAVVKGLAQLKRPCTVEVYSDSQYVVKAVLEGWLRDWVRKGFRAGKKNEVKNIGLWKELLPLLDTHEVRFHWVKGHVGVEANERCDQLAKAEAMKFM